MLKLLEKLISTKPKAIAVDEKTPIIVSVDEVPLFFIIVIDIANSRGMNTLLIEIIFTCTIAVIVTLTVRWVGLLIINSLLVLPAAAARNISKNVRQYHLFSVLIAVFSGITGLIISYYLNTVTGATIVLVSAVIFFITLIIRRKFV